MRYLNKYFHVALKQSLSDLSPYQDYLYAL